MPRSAGCFGLLAVALLAGCVSVEHIPLAPGAAEALRGRETALASRDRPDFTAMTAARAAIGGLIGGAVMIGAGNRVVENNNVQDPAQAIAEAIAAELKEAHQMRFAPGAISVDTDDAAKIAKENPAGDLLLDVRTINWGYSYFPTTWNRYRVFYSARLRLIDLKRAQVLAEGFCSRMPDETPTAPTGDELLANGAEVLKNELKTAAGFCIEHFRTATFAFAVKAAPVAAMATPAAAAATSVPPVPIAPTSPADPTSSGVEIMFWESVRSSSDPADFRAYLEQYPQGRFAALARNRLAALGHAPAPAKPGPTSSAAPAQIATSAPASRLPSRGDTWTYRLTEPKRTDGPKQRNYVVKVSAASLSGIVEQYSIDQGPAGEWTHKGERHVVALGKSVFAPYLLAFGDLPQGSLGRLQVVDPACGAVYVCQASGRTLAWETIRLPAGTFDTVRVEVQHNWRPGAMSGPQGAQNYGGRTLTVWYSLAAKRAVKFSSRSTFGPLGPIDADFDLELVSYRLQ
jgi:hypothetical protein